MALSKSLGENVNDIITDMDNHNNCLPQLLVIIRVKLRIV